MKKRFYIGICLITMLLCFGCASKTTEQTTTATKPEADIPRIDFRSSPRVHLIDEYEGGYNDGGEWTPYRRAYYHFASPFAEIVGRDAFFSWAHSRTAEEWAIEECFVVSFVKHFKIKKRDFKRANEVWRARAEELGWTNDPIGEAYDVDLIYTFDNEKINEFFFWKNGPYPEYTHIPTPEEYYAMPEGERWSDDRTPYRPIYYSLAASYADLVDRDVLYDWETSRTQEEANSECIA